MLIHGYYGHYIWFMIVDTGNIWGFPKIRGPQNGWFKREHPNKNIQKWMMTRGYDHFRKPTCYINVISTVEIYG